MKDFVFYAPTEVAFGADSEAHLVPLLRKYGACKVLLHYGGQSAERSGLLGDLRRQLQEAGIAFVELGGVVPNPLLSKVHEGIELVRREHIDFILAVGGGSVIDSAKAIGYGAPYDGEVWDIYAGKYTPVACLPVGVVLTIPAAGSEMSNSSVITRDEGELKRGYTNDICRPRFAIMNPKRTFTLPAYQTAAGITDIMMHTLERYFCEDGPRELTDAVAEALLRTMVSVGPRLMADPLNYDLRAEVMWAGSLAHNDVTGLRSFGDWATHQIEHELSALYGATHGAGLAAVWDSWATYVLPAAPARFAQLAANVFGLAPSADQPFHTVVGGLSADAVTSLASAGISSMKAFFHSLGMPTSIPELIGRPATEEEISLMAEKCTRSRTITQGKVKALSYDDIVAIYQMANK